ncbi:MAG: sigma-E processing peptidase SpoIIGA [Bacillota bacterium]
MVKYTVYVDEILVSNLLMNYAILHLTTRLAGTPYSFFRLLTAALAGSLYVFTAFLPGSGYYHHFAGKLVLSLAVVLIAFGRLPWRRFLSVWALFYGVSFALGGVVLGVISLLGGTGLAGGREIIYRNFWVGVLAALVLVAVAGKKGRLLRRRVSEGFFRVPVTIGIGPRRIELEALLDTGNQLNDPVTWDPVVIVEADAVREHLPLPVRKALDQNGEPDFTALAADIEDPQWQTRLRLIPYRSLGKTGGLLLGFKPDVVEVVYGGRTVKTSRVVVGIYRNRLSPEGKYSALLNPRLIEALL